MSENYWNFILVSKFDCFTQTFATSATLMEIAEEFFFIIDCINI